MEIIKETTVKLSIKDLEKILKEHLRLKGVDVKSINFELKAYSDEDDWRGEYPSSYRLEQVVCKGIDI